MSTETTPGPGATGGDDAERPTRARGGDGASAPTSSSTASSTASTDGHSAAAGNGRTAVLDPPEGEAAVVTAPVAGGAASPAAPPAPPPGSSLARKATPWGISLVVLVAGMFMSVLDISIVNVATPRMQNDFGVTLEDIQWVSTAYSLAEGVIVPASAWLGLKFGLGRSYMWALVLFTIASALCGLAWDLNSMIAFRVIQAIPGGVIPVVALTMLYKVVPKEKIGSAMGLYGLGIVVAPGIGPTLGGYLVEYVNWRLIFFINIPIGVIGVLAAWYYLPKFASAKAHRFDTKGFLAIATGLFALLVALHEGEEWGWTSPAVLGLALYGVLAIAMFVVIELEVKHPLLNVRIFTTWAYTNSLIIIGVVMMGMFGVLFFIPQSLQQNQGLGAFETGLVLLPQAIAMAVIMPIAGLLYDRIGARWPAMIGLSICTYGTWLLHDVTINTSHSELAWILAMRAAGVALAMMPIMTGGMSSLSPDLVGGASAFNTVVQRSSSAIGLAGLTAVMTGFQSQFFADRTAVMPANGAAATSGSIAEDGGSAGGSMLEMYSMNAQVQTQVFDTAFSNLMILTTALTALSVVLAFFLPGGKPAPGGATHVEM